MTRPKFKNHNLTTTGACFYWRIEPNPLCYQKCEIKSVTNLYIKYNFIFDESLCENLNT